jgi:uncharacterized membrane protein YdbT with pleckstrin-like domain
LPPLILIPTVVGVAAWMNRQFVGAEMETRVDFRYLLAVVGFLLLFPIWAKLKTRFLTRYRVTLDSVVEEHGLLSKVSSEIRIQDIRNIVVKQSIVDRILLMGNISFSSAAGSGVEVKFHKVARPSSLKVLVRDIQAKLSDGELTDDEIREIAETAGTKTRDNELEPSENSPSAVEPSVALAEEVLSASEPKGEASASGSGDDTTGGVTAQGDSTREELYRLLAEQQTESE